MKNIIFDNKRNLKYKDYQVRGQNIFVLGIGKKAFKVSIDDGEEEFIFFDSFEGRSIMRALIKSFENEAWNDEIRSKIEAQKEYCHSEPAPHFAPEDGFCWSCGEQIYTRISKERASSDLITGCPHCCRSYCD